MSTFYHGTDIDSAISICDKIVLKKSSKRTDFGPGFYVTNNIETAKTWAFRKAAVRRKEASIVYVEFDEDAVSDMVQRFSGDLRWGRFVINNRNGYDYVNRIDFKEHNLDARYPITYGRIADYEVRDIARKLYQTGEILESIEGIFNPFYSFQYAFHSERALSFINSTRYEKIEREV